MRESHLPCRGYRCNSALITTKTKSALAATDWWNYDNEFRYCYPAKKYIKWCDLTGGTILNQKNLPECYQMSTHVCIALLIEVCSICSKRNTVMC